MRVRRDVLGADVVREERRGGNREKIIESKSGKIRPGGSARDTINIQPDGRETR